MLLLNFTAVPALTRFFFLSHKNILEKMSQEQEKILSTHTTISVFRIHKEFLTINEKRITSPPQSQESEEKICQRQCVSYNKYMKKCLTFPAITEKQRLAISHLPG